MGDVRIRNTNYNKLKSFLRNVKDHATTPLTYAQAKSTLKMAANVMQQTEEVQQRLLLAAADPDAIQIQQDAFFPILNTMYEIEWRIEEILNSLPNPTHGTTTTSSNITVKLPTMELPTFDGNFTNWMSYKDLFLATVDKNRQLAPAQKLQYLKSSLQGEPANLIRNTTITDANYAEAWKLLNDRYNNDRKIISSLIIGILTAKPVQHGTALALKALLDTTMESLRSLKVLGQLVDQWDALIIENLLLKVDEKTKMEWAIKQTTTNVPTLAEFTEFVESRIRGLEAIMAPATTKPAPPERKREKQVRSHHASSEVSCQICKGSHMHFKCPDLNNKSIQDRISSVKKLHLCYNCLQKGHGTANSKSEQRCRKCHKKHHTLLHEDRAQPSATSQKPSNQDEAPTPKSNQPEVTSHVTTANTQVLLKTAIVKVKDARGQYQPVRVFLDDGSQATLITDVTGISDTDAGSTMGKVFTTLHSSWNVDNFIDIEAHILKRVTCNLPKYSCHQVKQWNHLAGLQLADPNFHQPGPIDILLDAEYYEQILRDGRRVVDRQTSTGPHAQNSIFGWFLSGRVEVMASYAISTQEVTTDEVHQLIKRFWEVEEPPFSQLLTKEERQCEELFKSSISRDHTGRYIVSVPFNEKKLKLGQSRDSAIKRFLQVERRLARYPAMKEQYVQFMQEYQQLGHMQKVPPSQVTRPDGATYYLPHHCVLNQASTTTKLRVVLDGCAKTTTGISLNEAMLVGPTVQDDLYDILLRFRMFPVALKADISKMYRQFKLQPSDTDYHRILWRESSDQPLEDYRLLTVTYGTACAPYLATRCLQPLGIDSAEKYPQASKSIIQDSYVDDLMTGETTDERTIALYGQITRAVGEGQMDLRKWSSSSTAVLKSIPEAHRETDPHEIDPEHSVKALGVQWIPSTDMFTFKHIELPEATILTKRKLSSDLAKVFDPLCFISPIVIRAKLLLQEVWKLSIDWDQPVALYIQQQWQEYQEDMKRISEIQIPRRISISSQSGDGLSSESYVLHGFSDASEVAYGAVIYLQTTTAEGVIASRMITSKTKVCPIRQITLPRLELMAAVLLAELVDHLIHTLHLECDTYLWTDSTITLSWITSPPRRWKTFVANRVSRIQECSKVENWRHVPGVDNPADLASRGVPVARLIEDCFWWKGPTWLSEPSLPAFATPDVVEGDLEERPVPDESPTAHVHSTNVDMSILERFSTLADQKTKGKGTINHCHQWNYSNLSTYG